MHSLLLRTGLGLAILFFASTLEAEGIVNGGFESDDFAPWIVTTTGKAVAEILAHGGPETSRYAQLTTWVDPGDQPPQGDVLLQQAFVGSTGDVLSFDYLLDVTRTAGALGTGCLEASKPATGMTLFSYCIAQPRPWASDSYTLPESGEYTLTFHATAKALNSEASVRTVMGIANVRLLPVPEPGTMVLLMVAASLWLTIVRRRQ